RSSSLVLLATLYSTDGMYDVNYIGNYALVNIIDELKRIKGVGDAQVMTTNDYAIRIWLKPSLFNRFNLGVNEVISAVQTQNTQRRGGTIGAMPMSGKILKTFPLITPPRLVTPEQFSNIILRASPDGSTLRIKDIADVNLGAQNYTSQGYYDKKAAVPIGIYLSAGANAVETANLAKKALNQMAQNFPEGISYDIAYDTTVFVKESIKGVIETLIEAFILVFFVVFLFLKDWRATVIPCVVVPVAIIGAFLGMLMLGFSINSLTLFGLVLAIGMVVDDAIVVIENADRILTTQNMPVKDAVTQAMNEVSGPIVAIVLVLCSVFIPVGFMGGFSGVMYQQFAITIAISVVISGLMALTLTPAMCGLMLKKERKVTKGFFFKFDNLFEKFTAKYVNVSEFFIRKVKLGVILFAVFCLLAFILFKMVPSNLLPDEDQGLLMVYSGLDPATSLNQTDEVAKQVEDVLLSFPEVKKEFTFSGFNILNSTSQTNAIASFVTLKPWDERKKKNHSASALVGQVAAAAQQKVPKALIMPFMPPAIMGLSTTGGIEGYIQS
ncbi:MAG: efflux RND transporter permease subunit, partial [Elusimicrobiaceae bacterium]|nr:efflux RND transporter permease subunit [Elusimicrobiaceae bacterium]